MACRRRGHARARPRLRIWRAARHSGDGSRRRGPAAGIARLSRPRRHEIRVSAEAGTRAILVGGIPPAEPVLIWWNFVGYDKTVIAQAQRDWEAADARFGTVPGPLQDRMTAPPLPWPGV
nr:pirin-like C-terminal cupin domain-containing protein [Verticiella sp. GG226]